ncbi:MAG: TIGR02206 family membrane protein [Oscillospiraceae bacterium]|nr:TIGR02206 family membrane protein [Oscillospiraceae bacterium]
MQGAQLACWLGLGAAALAAVRAGRVSGRAVGRAACALLALCMAATITLTVLDGKDLLRTLLPLHLCSLSALLTLPVLARARQACLNFCWYLGLPGAAMALLFPAIEPSGQPHIMATAFFLTHGLIVFAPLLCAARGQWPRRRAMGPALLAGNLFLALVYGADRLLGANYMFLLWPPAGTPLDWMARWGRVGYFAWLELCGLLAVWAMRGLLTLLQKKAKTWATVPPAVADDGLAKL